MAHDLIEGWQGRIIDQLVTENGPLPLTGMTVVLLMNDGSGASFAFAGTAGIETAATGRVYFDPASTDITVARGPLAIRWKVIDGSSKPVFFPNTSPRDVWRVIAP